MVECYVCQTTQNLHRHHVFGGSRRKWSEKYGMVVYLCWIHHNMSKEGVHFNKSLDIKLKQKYQRIFQFEYPDLDFMKIFGRNYL